MAMPWRSARSITSADRRDGAARFDRQDSGAGGGHRSSVPRPIVGTSNRMSCCGLATLTTVKPPAGQSAPARRMHSSVPSIASTASGVRPYGHALADVEPAQFLRQLPAELGCLSVAAADGPRRVSCPGSTSNSGAKSVAGTSVIPAWANASTTRHQQRVVLAVLSAGDEVRPKRREAFASRASTCSQAPGWYSRTLWILPAIVASPTPWRRK